MSLETAVAPATGTDTADLAILINSPYRGQRNIAGWTDEVGLIAGKRIDDDALNAVRLTAGTTILLLRRKADEALLGCISVGLLADATCYISLLAIDPRVQSLGYGRQLLAEAEKFAQSCGAQTARITVIRQREALIAWYERRGYRQTGDVIPFPYGTPGVGTPLRYDLHLLVLEKPISESRDIIEGNDLQKGCTEKGKDAATISRSTRWVVPVLAAMALSYWGAQSYVKQPSSTQLNHGRYLVELRIHAIAGGQLIVPKWIDESGRAPAKTFNWSPRAGFAAKEVAQRDPGG